MAGNQIRIPIGRIFAAVLFVLLLVAGAFLIYPVRVKYRRQQNAYAQQKALAELKRAERDALAREVADLESSPAAIEKVARVNYRLCKEGELVLYYREPGVMRRDAARPASGR